MNKFTVRLLLFCLAPIPLLFALHKMVDTGLRKSRHFYYSEWNDIFNGKANADLLILGSSRAWVQISPQILDSTLHTNSYNLGMDGSQFNMQYQRFRLYLQHNRKPKYIVQEIGFTSTLGWFNELPTPEQFLPYLSDSSIWAISQWSATPFSLLDRYFPMYKYNNQFPLVKEGLLSYFGKGVKGPKYKGYEGQLKVWDSSFRKFTESYPNGKAWAVSPVAIKFFREYLDFCKANDIKVILVFPPAFIQSLDYVKNKAEILGIFQGLAKEYNLPYYNYMYDSLAYSRDNFYNSMHLNKRGAEAFSHELAGQLKEVVIPAP